MISQTNNIYLVGVDAGRSGYEVTKGESKSALTFDLLLELDGFADSFIEDKGTTKS